MIAAGCSPAAQMTGGRFKVVEDTGSPEILTDVGSESYAVINLRAVVRDVLAIGAEVA